MLSKMLKNTPFLSKLLLYLWQKKHNGDKVKFWYSTHISYRCKFEGMNMVGPRTSFFGSLGYGSYVGGNGLVSAEIGRLDQIVVILMLLMHIKFLLLQHVLCSSLKATEIIHEARLSPMSR